MSHLQRLAALSSQRATPSTLHLELTYRCNARCGHCLQDRNGAPDELGLADWLRVLEAGRRMGALYVALSGGEAMLSPHFWDLFAAARRLGYAVRVYSNGLRLDRDTVKRLAALSPYAVDVSIFSLDARRHDAVLGVPGSLRRTLRGLVMLRRAGVHTVLKCPLLSGTADDHARIRELATRLGAGVVFDPAIFSGTDGRSGPTRCRGEDRDLEAYFAAPETRAHDHHHGPRASEAAPCGMARSFVVVGPAGAVHPCAALPADAGNVRDAPLDEIWTSSPVMRQLRARSHGALPVCGSCPRSGYCGRCSAIALLEDGDLDGPSARACHIAELRERAWGVPTPPGAPAVAAPRRNPLRVLG